MSCYENLVMKTQMNYSRHYSTCLLYTSSIAFDFENGSGTYTYQGKIAGSFVSADTYLVIPEGVYRSMNPRGTVYGYLWVDCDKTVSYTHLDVYKRQGEKTFAHILWSGRR